MTGKFEDRLLADLVAAQQSIEPAPGVSPGFRRRRTALRLGLVAVVIAGAVAAVLGLVVFNGGQPKASAAEIKQRALAALTGANDLIMHSSQTSTSYDYSASGETSQTINEELWEDLTANRTRSVVYGPDGQPRFETVTTHSGASMKMEIVQYDTHTWTTASGTLPFAFPGGGGSAEHAQNIEDELANGVFVLLGPETVDGQKTLHLRQQLPQLPNSVANAPPGFKPPPRPVSLEMWIDPSSYLPVREETLTASGQVGSQRDYAWLPRTPDNLAKLELVVPPGFTHETEPMQPGASCTTTTPSNGGTIRSCSFSFGVTHP